MLEQQIVKLQPKMLALEPSEQLLAEVERVTATEPVVLVSGPTAKQKDPKKVAAGKVGAAAHQAKQEKLLAEL